MERFPAQALAGDPVAKSILTKLPYVVPFPVRLRIFEALLGQDRAQHQPDKGRPKHRSVIRRDRYVEDGLAELNGLGRGLKGLIAVEFVDVHGLKEPGIDMGGVFKEYLIELITLVFGPSFGLFKANPNEDLFPNPMSRDLQPSHLQLFEFLGRMFGKAMYDGIVLDIPFAYFFLSRLLGRPSSLNELRFLDADLYKNLLMCKSYEGDVEDFGLTFSVTEDHFGKVIEKELIEGGSETDVTAENVHQYIYLVAHVRLNQDIAVQSNAFLSGFRELINAEWVQMFNQRELQRLISGDDGGDFDVEDLKAHTEYYGGYGPGNSTIKDLWKVVNEFSAEEKSAFLRFVTSCPRPPLTGFGAMHPTFKIQMVDCGVSGWEFWTDAERLPSASTCFNLLKLPNYNKRSTLREKLKLAMESGASFGLS